MVLQTEIDINIDDLKQALEQVNEKSYANGSAAPFSELARKITTITQSSEFKDSMTELMMALVTRITKDKEEKAMNDAELIVRSIMTMLNVGISLGIMARDISLTRGVKQ